MMFWFWISTVRMTVAVCTDGVTVTVAPPIVRKFVGQRLTNLIHWMKRQPGDGQSRGSHGTLIEAKRAKKPIILVTETGSEIKIESIGWEKLKT